MFKLILTIGHGYYPQGNNKMYYIHSYKIIVNESRKYDTEDITK